MYLCVYMCEFVGVYVCTVHTVYVGMHVCAHVHMYARTHTYKYTYIIYMGVHYLYIYTYRSFKLLFNLLVLLWSPVWGGMNILCDFTMYLHIA